MSEVTAYEFESAAAAIAAHAPGAPLLALSAEGDAKCWAFVPDGAEAPVALVCAENGEEAAAVFAGMRPPVEIQGATELPAGTAWLSRGKAALRFTFPARVGFDVHWPREVAAGRLEGVVGIRLDGGVEAAVSARIDGGFGYALTREYGGLRLRWFRQAEEGESAASRLQVCAKWHEPRPERGDDLLAALLNVHPVDWLRWLTAEIGSSRWSGVTQEMGVRTRILTEFLERWQRLPAPVEGILWKAVRTTEGVAPLLRWATRAMGELGSPGAMSAAIADAFDTDAAFAETAAGQWLEAASGQPLWAALSRAAFERMRGGARTLLGLFHDEEFLTLFERLAAEAAEHIGLDQIGKAASNQRVFFAELPWLPGDYVQLLGEGGTKPGWQKLKCSVERARQLRAKICDSVHAALERRTAAELASLAQAPDPAAAWLDASFENNDQGIAQLRRCLTGDLASVQPGAAGVTARQSLVTHRLRRVRHIELHLPYTSRKMWELRQETLAHLDVWASEDGAIHAFGAETGNPAVRRNQYQGTLALASAFFARKDELERSNFHLRFHDTRKLEAGPGMEPYIAMLSSYGLADAVRAWLAGTPPGSEVEAGISFSMPGTALSTWANAPTERDPASFPVFARMSVAVQQTLRRWLPAAYFTRFDRYLPFSLAAPLLTYEAMDPFPGKPRSTYTFDVLDRDSMDRAWRSASRRMTGRLTPLYQRLKAAGRKDMAALYHPKKAHAIVASQRRSYRMVHALLVAEEVLVKELIGFAGAGRDLHTLNGRNPGRALKVLSKSSDQFSKTIHGQLRHAFRGSEWESLGSLLLMEATRALRGGAEPPPLAAVLTLRCGNRSTVLTNAAVRE